MNVIIVWYHCNRIPFTVPKRKFNRLLHAGMVMWIPFYNEWAVITSEANIHNIADAQPL